MIREKINNIVAAIIFFTRVPLYRVVSVSVESFRNILPFWSLTGVLTGGAMALSAYLLLAHFSPLVSVVLAVCVRLLLTGALHEDGLADCFDGFGGGGGDRERTLNIMKDSRIGTYGVLSLVCVCFVYVAVVSSFPVEVIPLVMFAADVSSKSVASNIVNILPYARKEEEAKSKVAYEKMSLVDFLFSTAVGVASIIPLGLKFVVCFFPLLFLLICFSYYAHRRIGGYTGDCCGALFLLSEVLFILSAQVLMG